MDQHPTPTSTSHSIQRRDGWTCRLLGVQGVPADRIRWADQYALKKQSITDAADGRDLLVVRRPARRAAARGSGSRSSRRRRAARRSSRRTGRRRPSSSATSGRPSAHGARSAPERLARRGRSRLRPAPGRRLRQAAHRPDHHGARGGVRVRGRRVRRDRRPLGGGLRLPARRCLDLGGLRLGRGGCRVRCLHVPPGDLGPQGVRGREAGRRDDAPQPPAGPPDHPPVQRRRSASVLGGRVRHPPVHRAGPRREAADGLPAGIPAARVHPRPRHRRWAGPLARLAGRCLQPRQPREHDRHGRAGEPRPPGHGHGRNDVTVNPQSLHGPAFREAPDKLANADRAMALGWVPTRDLATIIRDASTEWLTAAA
jgi:hypothetical protein